MPFVALVSLVAFVVLVELSKNRVVLETVEGRENEREKFDFHESLELGLRSECRFKQSVGRVRNPKLIRMLVKLGSYLTVNLQLLNCGSQAVDSVYTNNYNCLFQESFDT